MTRGPNESITPRAMLEHGSPEWCRQTVVYAKTLWAAKAADEQRWRKVLAELRAHRAWRPLGFKSLDALLKDAIGLGERASLEVIQLGAQEYGKGKPGPGRGKTDSNATRFPGRGAAYTLARLDRDRPDLAARVRSGEPGWSAHRAAREAGFRPPTCTVRTDDVHAAVRVLLKHFTAGAIAAALSARGGARR